MGKTDIPHDKDIELVRNKSAQVRQWLQHRSRKRPDHNHSALPNVLFEAASAGIDTRVLDTHETIEKIRNITRLKRRGTERDFAVANCVFNSVDAVAWLMRAFLSIYDAARSCGNRKAACAAMRREYFSGLCTIACTCVQRSSMQLYIVFGPCVCVNMGEMLVERAGLTSDFVV